MQSLDFSILYVADAVASTDFYTKLLGRPPVQASPTFAMFAFDNKAMLGIWGVGGVEPPVTAKAGGSEVALVAADHAAVEAAHKTWVESGFTVGQPPKTLDFGYSAVVIDPDGHRVRVMAPGA